ncbi:hypothetical protein NC651_029161 [Populus alba x Populus x berolinensis]|nr:hypothetical protein NC651_029161 [Populus alba x Populus x berolinensis]
MILLKLCWHLLLPTLLSIPSHSSTSSRSLIRSIFNLEKAVNLAISPSLILAFSSFSIPKNPASNLLSFNDLNSRLSRLGKLPNGCKTSRFAQSLS